MTKRDLLKNSGASRLVSTKVLAFAIGLASLVCLNPCDAQSQSKAKKNNGVIYSYDMFDTGITKKSSQFQTMKSEMALGTGDVDRAIRQGRRAVEKEPNNMEARIALGEALYAKVNKKDPQSNPDIYNECVKTWLMVHRNLIGDETGMQFKGISIPFAQRFFEDEDQGVKARDRLNSLCGRTPKAWETNKKFLSKVLVPETQETVSGTIISKPASSQSQQSKETY